MSQDPLASQVDSTSGRAGGLPLALLAGVGVALLLLALEGVVLALGRGPARPLDALREALPLTLLAGGVVGVLGGLLARGARATDTVRIGLPLVLLTPLFVAVHLSPRVLGPGDGLTSSKGLLLFGAAAGVAGLALFGCLAAGSGGGGKRRSSAGPLFLLGLVLLAGVWVWSARSGPPAATSSGPNVVLVVLDTTRVDRLSAFGYERETTPELERLAAEGTRFSRCYAAAPWTVPSHAAMFTGTNTSTHGATRQRPILDARLPTLAERLAADGLHTVSFSKKSWLSHETGLLRGFEEVVDLHNPPAQHAATWLVAQVSGRPKVLDKGAAEIVGSAAEWLELHGDEGRFFAFFNFNEAHSDLRPPRKYRERFLAAEHHDSEWGRSRFPENHAFTVGEVEYSEQELSLLSDLYDAEVAYQDQRLGELIAAFEAAGLLDETLFLVTADHGENLGEHGLLGHEMSLHETLLHVPLVARLPGRIPAGLDVADPVENRLVGRLIQELLTGQGELAPGALAALLDDPGFEGIVGEEYAPNFRSPKWGFEPDERFDCLRKSLVDGTRKLVFASNLEEPRLHDLVSDPGELVDLREQRSEEAQALFQRLLEREDLWTELAGSGIEFSAEMEGRLRQMGYF